MTGRLCQETRASGAFDSACQRVLRPVGAGLGRVVLAAMFMGALAGCGDRHVPASAAPAAAVSVARVLARPIQQWDAFNGRISAIDTVEIRPRVSGYVQRIAFDEGGEVRKGDLLFVIDARPMQAAFDVAVARLERARAGAALARQQAQRSNDLYALQAVSRDEAERTRAASEQGRADVAAAQAAVEAAKLDLQFCEVRAPVAGRVGHAMLTVGNLAMADQTVLTTVVSQDPVYVDFYPDEDNYLRYQAQVRRAKHAPTVRVGLVSDPGFPHEGRVTFSDNRVDPATGTNHMRAVLHNPGHQLTPGLYAHVQFAGLAPVTAALIDDKAVLTDQDRKYVYVLGAGNKAERREVQLGPVNEGLRVVAAGLSSNDFVIVDGLQRVFYPGAPVTPTVVAMDAPAQVAAVSLGSATVADAK